MNTGIYRPSDTEDLCEALKAGETCEVPNQYALKAFGALAYHGICAEVEVNRENEGWTTYKLSNAR